VDWIYYLDYIEPNLFHREDWFAAQIAKEVQRSRVNNVNDWKQYKDSDFLIPFKIVQKDEDEVVVRKKKKRITQPESEEDFIKRRNQAGMNAKVQACMRMGIPLETIFNANS
jgi:hypothetical protein